MLWVKLGTHITDHERFLAAGAVARDLYVWGLTYSGKHELDGQLPMVAVLSSAWGAGPKANIKVAAKLVDVGLWLRTDCGFLICRWSEQGNQTKAQIVADRDAARDRMSARRSANVRANAERTSPDVPTSTSTSNSESRSPEPEQIGIASPPAWWEPTLATIEMATGERVASAPAWLRYAGHRASKEPPRPPTASDAQYWITTVIVPELKRERDEVRRRDKRDLLFDEKRRFAKEGPPKPPPLSKEQEHAFAEQLAARVRERRAAGGGR